MIEQTKEEVKKYTRDMIIDLENWWEKRMDEVTSQLTQYMERNIKKKIRRQEERWYGKLRLVEERVKKVEENIKREEEKARGKIDIMEDKSQKDKNEEKERTSDMEVEEGIEKDTKKNNRKE